MTVLQEEVRKLADQLPVDATWEHVVEAAYLRHVVEQGLKAGSEGRQKTIAEVRKHFGLPG